MWSGIDDRVWGTWSPPSLVEKLLSGDGIKVTEGLGVSLSGRAFVASQGVPWERLGDREAILLCECFNNVD